MGVALQRLKIEEAAGSFPRLIHDNAMNRGDIMIKVLCPSVSHHPALRLAPAYCIGFGNLSSLVLAQGSLPIRTAVRMYDATVIDLML